MPLLNYSTSISADKTVGEIQSKLAKAGARQILHEYDPDGNVTALSFRIETKFGNMAFRLPANISAVEKTLAKQTVTRRSYGYSRNVKVNASLEQATRVGWRILKDWMEAQLALIETGMVEIEEVFLPYAQNNKGQTVYEGFLEKKFSQLQLCNTN
jgi:hypothetical protein